MWFKLFRKIEVIGDLNIEMQRFSGRLSTLQKNIHMLDQRFDLLTDMLGIEIAADNTREPPKAFVKSMSDKSLFASSREYIDAVITAEKLLALHYKVLQQQNELMKKIKWR